MPSSAAQSYSDADEYAETIRSTKSEISIVGRGTFGARALRIDMHRLWMQRFSESLPRIMNVAMGRERAVISFHTKPGPTMIRGGAETSSDTLTRVPAGVSFFQRTTGPTCWGSLSLPMEDACTLSAAIAGFELTPPLHRIIATPPAAAFAKLQRLHAVAGDLVERAPEIIANAEAARGLEQALIGSWVACVASGDVVASTAAQRRHSAIMRRFYAEIEAHIDEAVYVSEICRATNASQRTLNMCCHEALGMGPKRYLLLRRMQLAWRALSRAKPGRTTVTDIATSLGFFDLGRFSVEYRRLFGESPSTTLRAPAT
jgi:AraC-like DNA-binding protein